MAAPDVALGWSIWGSVPGAWRAVAGVRLAKRRRAGGGSQKMRPKIGWLFTYALVRKAQAWDC